ncbi:MAG: hypothetical protein JWP69_1001 [Flaviaesturariibacter sp.]|nr:hypothetical protein [Flaviaesturariibacter sp.]
MLKTFSTYKLLAKKATYIDKVEDWVDWALEMLEYGYEAEHLYILAGLRSPIERPYLEEVIFKTLKELNLHKISDVEAVNGYAYLLISEAFNEKNSYETTLKELKELHERFDMYKGLQDFYLLYWALEDLKETDVQWYWKGADAGNILNEIKRVFLEWRRTYIKQNQLPISMLPF